MRSGPLRRDEWVALSVALLWSIGLLVAAVVAPAYHSTTETSSGTITSETATATLLDENGPAVLLLVGVPLLVTVIVGCALWLRGAGRGAGPIAWTFTALLAGFNVLALASIGLFMVPVTAALVVVCARRPTRPSLERDLSITPM